MPYSITLTPSAKRQLGRLQPPDQLRIATAVDALADSPRPSGAKALQGVEGLLRIRAGDYRIIYRVTDQPPEVTVVRIGHRGEVYRKGI